MRRDPKRELTFSRHKAERGNQPAGFQVVYSEHMWDNGDPQSESRGLDHQIEMIKPLLHLRRPFRFTRFRYRAPGDISSESTLISTLWGRCRCVSRERVKYRLVS